MCLDLTKDSTRLRKNYRHRKKPITVYKCVFDFDEDGIYSEYKDFKWKKGLNISDRESFVPTADEISANEVKKGFHFFMNKEEAEKYRLCQYLCPCRCLYRYQYPCPYPRPYFQVMEFTIDPKDVVAVGEFGGYNCLVAIKATLKEELTNDQR